MKLPEPLLLITAELELVIITSLCVLVIPLGPKANLISLCKEAKGAQHLAVSNGVLPFSLFQYSL